MITALIGLIGLAPDPNGPTAARGDESRPASSALPTREQAAERLTHRNARVEIGPNLRASSPGRGRNEPWVAVSPTNPDFVIGVSQVEANGGPLECTTMISRDGGRAWREIALPGQQGGCFDPMVVISRSGRTYVMHALTRPIDAPPEGGGSRRDSPRGTILVWSTNDDGLTWTGPTALQCPLPPDHPRMVVDDSGGRFDGRVYIAWNEARDTLLKDRFHVFVHSSDDGAESFGEPVMVTSATGGKLVTTEPLVLSDGTLLLTYYQFLDPFKRGDEMKPVFVARSRDGGQTFSNPERVLGFGSSAWRHLAGDFRFAYALPIFARGPSPDDPEREHLYVAWDDVHTGVSTIWISRSVDDGRSWSEAQQVNDTVPGDPDGPPDLRMTPVVAVTGSGVVGVAWYDRRDDPSRRCWRQYFSASLDGGLTFLPDTPISSAASCPDPGLAPTVHVSNLAEFGGGSSPDSQEIAAMPEGPARSALQRQATVRDALEEVYGPLAPRIRIAFDSGRNAWPGHYTGLAAANDGTFLALWADRRDGVQELFTARVAVRTGPAAPVPPTREADLTADIAVIAGPSHFDEGNGVASFEIQLRNVSERVVYAPLIVEVGEIAAVSGRPTGEFLNTDSGGTGVGATWDLTTQLGTARRLRPGDVSAARRIVVRVRPESGLDAVFRFRIRGRVTS